jgi:polysaccharide biosynthesis/export protein VpsN
MPRLGRRLLILWVVVWSSQAVPARGQGYRLMPSDLLVVDVVGEKDLALIERRVSPTGTISFPFLGDVEVKDKSAADVERLLRELLMKDYFVDPQVVVRVREYKKRVVTVLGQVNRQGVVEFPSEQGMNLLEAIGQGGGFTQLADTRNITISRGGQKITFNYKDFLRKPEQNKLPHVEPGDVIMVPETLL